MIIIIIQVAPVFWAVNNARKRLFNSPIILEIIRRLLTM
jgi:hypothetical protein